MELDIEMASLELNEKKRRFCAVGETSEKDSTDESSDKTGTSVRRSTRNRKRIRPMEEEKRRVYTKPKKLSVGAASDVASYYMNKKVKLVHTNLETIFEEPKSTQEVMGGRKFRRLINFAVNSPENLKTKKRHMKAKKVCSTKFLKSKKISTELLLQKLKELEQVQDT